MSVIFGLTAEQKAKRATFIGGSDAPIIAGGDPGALYALWSQKIGETKTASTETWERYMQHVVEVAALDWVEAFGCKDARGVTVLSPSPVTRRGEQPVSAAWSFIGCTLDGWSASLRCPLNVKKLSGWSGKKQGQKPLEWAIEKYTISTIHECLATGALYGYLILVIDGKEPLAQRIDADPWFAEEYIEKARQFWQWVELREPPPGSQPLAAPAVDVQALRTINLMNKEDRAACNWAGDFEKLAADFAGTEPAFRKHAIVREEIKKLIPDDVGEVSLGLFLVKRTKANAFVMKLEGGE